MSSLRAVVMLAATVHAFFHELSMETFNLTSLPKDSLFGYSLAYQSTAKRLLVSAPKASAIGQVFSIDLNTNAINPISIPVQQGNSSDENFWLGASVKATADSFVTCAPRYIEESTKSSVLSRSMVMGKCFISPNIGAVMRPMPRMSLSDRKLNASLFENQMDTFGWSIAITPQNEVMMGGPAMSSGRASLYKNPYEKKSPKLLNKWNITIPPRFNFGYSVTSGKFGSKEPRYAVSSTFGEIGRGKVYFFDSMLDNVGYISDDKIATMFGAVLCPASLGGFQDFLLVGAPLYTDETQSYDVGAVYIYGPSSKTGFKTMALKRIIRGNSDGDHFGSAIISMGDIDGDKIDEIVIGAPYANKGRGAVYVYSGADLLEGKLPRQTIQPEGFSTFGFSLTALQDYDENGCNELAIGSPDNNKVALLRTFAYITTRLRTELPINLYNRKNKTFLEFKSCLDVVYPEKPKDIEGDVIITVDIQDPDFIILEAKSTVLAYKNPLKSKKKTYCRKIEVLRLVPPTGEYSRVLAYNISAKLEQDPELLPEFNPSRVLLSKRGVLSLQYDRWISDCGDGHSMCLPKLLHEVTSDLPEPYTIGSSNVEVFSLSVQNQGDTAYEACVVLRITGVPIFRPPSTCTQIGKNETITCKPAQPIYNNSVWNINDLMLDTGSLTSVDENITIHYNIYNHCSNETDMVSVEKNYHLDADIDGISIQGRSIPDNTYNVTSTDDDWKKVFQHNYVVTNNGQTNWINVQSEITIHNARYIKGSDIPVIIFVDSVPPFECWLKNDIRKDGSVSGLCNIGNVKKNQKSSVGINIEINPKSLVKLSENQYVNVTTGLKIFLNREAKALSVQTLVFLQTALVPLWIIIVSALVGLLIIIIVTFVLFELGFLTRKNKDKLKRLKTEVYRQSVRRSKESSMRMSAREKQERDDLQLIEDAIETCFTKTDGDMEQDTAV